MVMFCERDAGGVHCTWRMLLNPPSYSQVKLMAEEVAAKRKIGEELKKTEKEVYFLCDRNVQVYAYFTDRVGTFLPTHL